MTIIKGQYLELSDKHINALRSYKKKSGVTISSHIMNLIDEDCTKNPELYEEFIPLTSELNKHKSIEDKTLCVFKYYKTELSVRGITTLLMKNVAPMDKLTLRLLVLKTLDKDIYYKTRTETRVFARYGLREWLR